MFSYFRVFVYAIFPLPAFTLLLLICPFPNYILKKIVNFVDTIMKVKPYPTINVSLLQLVLVISAATFFEMYFDLKNIENDHENAKKLGSNSDRLLIKMLREQRNIWISSCAFCSWLILYMLCDLFKKYFDALEHIKIIADTEIIEDTGVIEDTEDAQ